jgi:hypothetical protein
MGLITLTAETTVDAPPSGAGRLYVDAADNNRLKMKLADGQTYVMNMSGFDKNLLLNGGFDLAQRQVPGTLTSYNNATGRSYGADRWGITNGAANIQYQRIDTQAAPEAGLTARFYGKFKQITGTNKVAISQVLEGHPAMPLRGRKVRLQARFRQALGSGAVMRLGLLQLTSAGTIDSIPATFLSALGAGGTDPTPGTNLAYITPDANTQVTGTISGNALSCTLSSTWQNFGAVFSVPSNCKNLIAMFWSNGVLATNDEICVGEAGMYDGPDIIDWVPIPFPLEIERCRRFYEKTFALETAPVQNAGVTSGCLRAVLGKASTATLAAQFQWRYATTKRANGTVVTFNPAAANAAVRQISGTAGDLTATAVANQTTESVDVTATGISTGAVGEQVGVHLTCDAEL